MKIGELPELWSIANHPKLACALRYQHRLLADAADEFGADFPMPPTVIPFVQPPLYRPCGSYRSYYRLVGEPPESVVAIKGAEPLLDDFEALLLDLRRSCYSPHRIAEHLVFEERKVPGCLREDEALREAERASEVQMAHLSQYGRLARIPIPLTVRRHAPDCVAQVRDQLRASLMPAAFTLVEPMLAGGLAVFVYAYPGLPIRVRDLDYTFRGRDIRQRLLTLLRDVGDPEAVIQDWIALFARLLHLGFVPGTLAALRTGFCCQVQNACLDGGMVDIDAVTPIAELDDTALQAALQLSTEALIDTVRTLLIGASDRARGEHGPVRVDVHQVNNYVLASLRSTLVREGNCGEPIDPRVLPFYDPPASLSELIERLGIYFSPPSQFDEPAVAAAEYGFGLLRRAASA